MSITECKKAIIKQLPTNRRELVYIIEKLGQILFKGNWTKINPYKYERKEFSKNFNGIILIIDLCFNNLNDKNELINFVFSECCKKIN